MDKSIYDLGHEQYRDAMGLSDISRDKDGFIVLKPTASRVDQRVESLTTNIDALEEKLKLFRAEKARAEKYQKTDDYKESKKRNKRKKQKKARTTLLEMVFNNADTRAEAEEEDEEGYRDNKGKGGRKKKDATNTLDSTYGQRFSPVVSMLYDSITDFDRIAREIEEELNSPRGQTRNMYRSTQIGNLLAAKDKKLSAVKELGSIAKTVSDLEYKKAKDKKSEEGADTTKAIASLGAKYLRGELDNISSSGKRGKGKKGKKEAANSNFKKSAKKMGYDLEDDDDEDDSPKKHKGVADETELAREFAKSLGQHRGDISLSPHERFIGMENKFEIVVVCDPLSPEDTWKYIAIDPKSKKKIDGFKDEFKELMPRRKDARMRFDMAKKRCTDLNTSKTYRLLFE